MGRNVSYRVMERRAACPCASRLPKSWREAAAQDFRPVRQPSITHLALPGPRNGNRLSGAILDGPTTGVSGVPGSFGSDGSADTCRSSIPVERRSAVGRLAVALKGCSIPDSARPCDRLLSSPLVARCLLIRSEVAHTLRALPAVFLSGNGALWRLRQNLVECCVGPPLSPPTVPYSDSTRLPVVT
jgi:hypothetical protein